MLARVIKGILSEKKLVNCIFNNENGSHQNKSCLPWPIDTVTSEERLKLKKQSDY